MLRPAIPSLPRPAPRPRWSLRLLAALAASLLIAAPSGAQAQSCQVAWRITFADGQTGCLDRTPVSEMTVPGWMGPLRRLVPFHGYYTVAATPGAAACRPSMALALPHPGIDQHRMAASAPERRERVLRECRVAVAQTDGACACQVVLEDGRSALSRADFDAWFATPGAALAAAPSSPPAAAAAPASAAPPASSAAAPSAATAPSPAPAEPPAAAPTASSPPAQPPAPAATPAAATTAAAAAASTAPASTPPSPAVTGEAAPSQAAAQATVAATSTTADDIARLRAQLEALQAAVSAGLARPAEPAPAAPAPPPRTARALVIGNGAYTEMGLLPNPRNDATAMAQRLHDMGIEVDLVLDADRQTLVLALARFQERSAVKDINILYYAGHGMQIEGVNYLLPVDMRSEGATAGAVKLNGIALNDALDYLSAPTRLVFLDACRDNPIVRRLAGTRSATSSGLAPMSVGTGTLISFATRDGATAADGSGRHSPYTAALLQHLAQPQDIALVLRDVRQSVMAATGNRQEPWEYGSLIGGQLVLSQIARRPASAGR